MEKLVQKCYYLDFTLLFENSPDFILDKMQLKVMVLHALQRLHGQVGASIPVDILKCKSDLSMVRGTIQVPNRELVKLWSALTLLGSYGEYECACHINKLSASLMGLAVDSRHFLLNKHSEAWTHSETN